jgi:hypothetical protein
MDNKDPPAQPIACAEISRQVSIAIDVDQWRRRKGREIKRHTGFSVIAE